MCVHIHVCHVNVLPKLGTQLFLSNEGEGANKPSFANSKRWTGGTGSSEV